MIYWDGTLIGLEELDKKSADESLAGCYFEGAETPKWLCHPPPKVLQ